MVEAFTRLGIGRPAAEALMSTPRWAMARALRELEEEHGGIEQYLLGPGAMSPQAMSTLRNPEGARRKAVSCGGSEI